MDDLRLTTQDNIAEEQCTGTTPATVGYCMGDRSLTTPDNTGKEKCTVTSSMTSVIQSTDPTRQVAEATRDARAGKTRRRRSRKSEMFIPTKTFHIDDPPNTYTECCRDCYAVNNATVPNAADHSDRWSFFRNRPFIPMDITMEQLAAFSIHNLVFLDVDLRANGTVEEIVFGQLPNQLSSINLLIARNVRCWHYFIQRRVTQNAFRGMIYVTGKWLRSCLLSYIPNVRPVMNVIDFELHPSRRNTTSAQRRVKQLMQAYVKGFLQFR